MRTSNVVTFFRTIPIFYELADADLQLLAEAVQEQCYTPGATVMELDAEDIGLFAVVEGECQAFVEHPASGVEVEVRRYYPGEHFGAEGILAGGRSVMRVRALSATRVLIVPPLTVLQLLASSAQFARALCRVFASDLQRAIREHRGIQFVHLEDFPHAQTVCRLMPRRVSSICRAIAVAQNLECVTVAMVNPSDTRTRSFIRQVLSDYQVQFVAVTDEDFESHGRRILGETVERTAWTASYERMLFQDPEGTLRPLGGTHEEDLLSDILTATIRSAASDVHFEPYGSEVRARLRVDGRMYAFGEMIHAATYRQLASRIKVLAELDTTRIRRPQAGRFVLYVDDRRVEFRVTVSPCHGGEKIVLRVVAPSRQMGELSNLILYPPLQRLAHDLFSNPSGLILVTGPSGAGKTTTLYAALNSIVARDSGISVVTIEDPVEYDLPFATQIQVHPESGMDFPTILKSVLRQDPDVILVGEIRDRESAAMAAEAATTGHLVLSSLHTYTAMEAVIRMRDLRVEPYLIAAGLKGVITQQLVPRLVAGCTEPVPLHDPTVQRLIELGIWNDQMPNTLLRGAFTPEFPLGGEQGRVAVYEMLSVTSALNAVIDRAGAMSEMLACLDSTCFASFGEYARFLLAEGIVAPERIVAAAPSGPALIRKGLEDEPGRHDLRADLAHACGWTDAHATAREADLESLPDFSLVAPASGESVDEGRMGRTEP
mgnify:CR=1 FL=1